MAKLLIHWHPQGSFLARSYIESLSLLGIDHIDGHSVYVLPGPSFMNQKIPEIRNRLEGPQSLFPQSNKVTILEGFYNFKPKDPSLLESAEYLSVDYICRELCIDKQSAMLLANSVRDTLHRGCLKRYKRFRLYKEWGERYWRRCFIDRLSYVLSLYKAYKNAISDCKPDIVAMSHPNYDIYIALYIAARRLDVPSLIVNGGYHLSYLCLPDNELVDPSPQSARASLLDAYSFSDETRLEIDRYVDAREYAQEASIGHLKESPIVQLQTHYQRLLRNFGIEKYLKCEYVLFLPILGEVNHHDCLADLVFGSKSTWIKATIRQLSDMGERCFYYRHHPLVDSYSERRIVEKLVSGYAREYLITAVNVSGESGFNSFLDQCSESNKVAEVLALGGNISTELAANSIRPIVANPCFASSGQMRVRSQLEIQRMVRLKEIYASEGAGGVSALDIRKVVSFTSLTGKGSSYDHAWRKSFDSRYFFGVGEEDYTPDEIASSYLEYINTYKPCLLKSRLGLHYYTDLHTAFLKDSVS